MSAELVSLNQEIASRVQQVENMNKAAEQTVSALADARFLDASLADDQDVSKTELESLYAEQKHYTAKNPIVYTQVQTDEYPYFQGELDTDGSPYYRPSLVLAGTDKGISPVFSEPTRVGPVGYGRDQDHSPKEDVPRTALSVALAAYPDHTGEPLPVGWPGAQEYECIGGTGGADQTACELGGGVWTLIPDPVWIAADTAPALIRTATAAWKADLQTMLADVHDDDSTTEILYQDAIDACDDLLALIPADAVFVRATGNGDPTAWGQTANPTGALLAAINAVLVFTDTSVPAQVTVRTNYLAPFVDEQEDIFFGIIKLRLHATNGSFSKVKAVENSEETNAEIIANHEESIRILNRLVIGKT